MGPKVIGVCGHIASGKSTVCKRTICELERSGVNCLYIEADKVAHECYAPGSELQDGLVEAFGKGIIDETGHVDRKALGAIVFDDESARLRLNGECGVGMFKCVGVCRYGVATHWQED
eukprot:Blabericola_migrator_1__2095@NODE_1579_length_4243_cov_359_533046_g747_i1_p4_GENE_NODE_1579_length_4243_cov_359_533046_g747_i1NODE_1579_length_4243_cov_359_533046_g747_i1_p4_ORF_typecomplete_len118_score12_91CoaE/PF01121_20/7_8e24PRK/PF00485_18/0_0003Zeta_toxin/PF06414_12/0_00028RecA/PF00154_21/0_0014AAA_33/PF13671_6/0_0016MobB/PF03205_14/0_0029APS_kinase/PF01583_20/0_0028NTPase_1/PF03266_15/0_0044KAP_NTPase/PF07693_14/0_0049AAA_22/PF13401_6/0_018GTP_EFTU/PF00009_27/0_027AAA_16/PF13191_6/0_027AA